VPWHQALAGYASDVYVSCEQPTDVKHFKDMHKLELISNDGDVYRFPGMTITVQPSAKNCTKLEMADKIKT